MSQEFMSGEGIWGVFDTTDVTDATVPELQKSAKVKLPSFPSIVRHNQWGAKMMVVVVVMMCVK